MKVTYGLAFVIFTITVTSAGKVPVKDDDRTPNHHHEGPHSIDKQFNNPWGQKPHDRRPPGGNGHREQGKPHKPPHFQTTEAVPDPVAEEVWNVTSTESESENTSTITTTVSSVSSITVNDVESEEYTTEDESTEDVTSTSTPETETDSENIGESTTAGVEESYDSTVSTDSESVAETANTAKTWWQRMLFWQ